MIILRQKLSQMQNMKTTINKKIRFTIIYSLLYILILGYPTIVSIFNPQLLDDGSIKYSLFFILFLLALVVTSLSLVCDIIMHKKLLLDFNDIEYANNIRKSYKRIGNFLNFLFLGLLVFAFVAPMSNVLVKAIFSIVLLIYFCIGFVCLGGFNTSKIVTLEKILKTEFTLYLRAFSQDTKSDKESHKSYYLGGYSNFVEKDFFKFYKNTVAVGQPGEVIAPNGCNRIYFRNLEWKESVEKMIAKANRIFILICSTESCIWEISKLNPYKDKIIFIVKDINDYAYAKKSLPNNELLPNLPNLETPLCYYFQNDGKFKILQFKHEISSYASIAKIIKAK